MKKFMMFGLIAALVACGSKDGGEKSPPPDTTTTDPTQPSEVDSGTTDPVVPGTDAGKDTSPAADAAPPVPTNQVECVAACEVKYPTPAAQNHALDTTCMLGTCGNVCNGIGSNGQNFGPDVDPVVGVVCDTVAAASYPILTPAAACSTCLANTPDCCNLWIAIFGSAQGQALNACANTCFTTFKN